MVLYRSVGLVCLKGSVFLAERRTNWEVKVCETSLRVVWPRRVGIGRVIVDDTELINVISDSWRRRRMWMSDIEGDEEEKAE